LTENGQLTNENDPLRIVFHFVKISFLFNCPEWKINFEVVNGVLYGNDRGYRYKLIPVDDGKFINPDDGASLVFDTKNKNAITLTLFGNTLKKTK
jgi:hypothetical protein